MNVNQAARQARNASFAFGTISLIQRNKTLSIIRNKLNTNIEQIIEANNIDLKNAEKEEISQPLLKRLKIDKIKINTLCKGIDDLINFKDPLKRTLSATELDKGLELYKVSCPLGVIGFIFESRPDALVQIATLSLKSGNTCLLKGGREAINTNKILVQLIKQAGDEAGLPAGWLHLLETREEVQKMLKLNQYINLIIPRGSNAFIRYIMENTTIPVLGHADGICHAYIHADAEIDMAVDLIIDSKCQYVAVCNALETLLVHEKIAPTILPQLKKALDNKGVEMRGCGYTCKIINIKAVTEKDWQTEYLDYILSIKIVTNLDQAIDHINRYGSGHTDTIITSNSNIAARFIELVDSANVFWNCSTRFSDGYVYGLGAEIGISTGKIHARGPVGLEGLVTYKWILIGHGQKIASYKGAEAKSFIHKQIKKSYNLS